MNRETEYRGKEDQSYNYKDCPKCGSNAWFIDENKLPYCSVCDLKSNKKVITKKDILKYKPPEWCDYPFTPDPMGYCWSWAQHIDGTHEFKNIKNICKCRPCEFYNGTIHDTEEQAK